MADTDYLAERRALESALDANRDELAEALATISASTRAVLTPTYHATRRPYAWLLIGVGLGVAVALGTDDS